MPFQEKDRLNSRLSKVNGLTAQCRLWGLSLPMRLVSASHDVRNGRWSRCQSSQPLPLSPLRVSSPGSASMLSCRLMTADHAAWR